MTRRRGGRGRGGGGPAAGRAGVPGRGEAGTGRGGPWLVLGGLGVSPQPEGGGLPACSGQSCTAPPPRTATPPLWVVFRRGRFVFRGTGRTLRAHGGNHRQPRHSLSSQARREAAVPPVPSAPAGRGSAEVCRPAVAPDHPRAHQGGWETPPRALLGTREMGFHQQR